MNKPAIQKFAVWARNELISQVSQRAYQYGIDEKNCDASLEAVGGRLLSAEEKSQRRELVRQIESKGYTQVMEEVAYTWFNRFIALRFMEVNNYLPSHIRVFSDGNGAFKPEILSDALHVDLPGLDTAKVAEYIEANDTETLYRYLLLTQCNALNEALPMMFERMGGYTEMLLPNNILKPDGVLGRMVADIPEDDWRDAVQIIGWLYQYYNTELKDDTFAQLKKNVKISKERIPAATQLFTPDWIVRYMVENSLGRLWLEGHPNDALKADWKYYLDDAEQEPDVEAQLEKLRAEYRTIKPEEIKVIDPCMGSGHILVYAFDVLMQIYEAQGVTQREAAQSILQNNLYGLDIDQRAAQLAYFAVMMKARQYDRRFLTRGIQPNLYHPGSYEEGREFGSILQVDALAPAPEQTENLFETAYDEAKMKWNFRRLLAQKYDVVVTNPPYMGASGMSAKLSEFVKKNYPDSKSDLFAVFIERCGKMVKSNGYQAMITQPSFLFLSSFEKLRKKVFIGSKIESLLHMGRGIFGIDFGSTAFVLNHSHISAYKGIYFRLHERTFQYIDPNDIDELFLHAKCNHAYKYSFDEYDTSIGIAEQTQPSHLKQVYFESIQDNFSKIPGSPVAYWVSENVFQSFNQKSIADCGSFSYGVFTCNNARFLRLWHECSTTNIRFKETDDCAQYWCLLNKGGARRKWFGNLEFVIDYRENGNIIRQFRKSNGQSESLPGENLYFKEHISWSLVSSGGLTFRYYPENMIFDISAPSMFNDNKSLLFSSLAVMNSKIGDFFLPLFNPTMNNTNSDIKRIPFLIQENQQDTIRKVVMHNIALSRTDWDSYEASWDFKRNPLV